MRRSNTRCGSNLSRFDKEISGSKRAAASKVESARSAERCAAHPKCSSLVTVSAASAMATWLITGYWLGRDRPGVTQHPFSGLNSAKMRTDASWSAQELRSLRSRDFHRLWRRARLTIAPRVSAKSVSPVDRPPAGSSTPLMGHSGGDGVATHRGSQTCATCSSSNPARMPRRPPR